MGQIARTTPVPDIGDGGLLDPGGVALLSDQYEFAMAASYLRQGMNGPTVFELFTRRLPPHRDWLLAAGLGPGLSLVRGMRFGEAEVAYLASAGFAADFLEYLRGFHFSGDIDAIPEGTVVFADEPLVRVTGPRIEAQLLETLLLNQVNFQTAIATKAARLVLAAGGGRPGAGWRVIDFSPRRDHGLDAAMKAARSAAIAGAGGTSNVAAAMRYGLQPVGTMAHSYVMSFESEEEAFRTFMRDTPHNANLLVDTYDTEEGVRRAIAAARDTGVPLKGVRLDSGDLLALSRRARELLDDAGLDDTRIIASGDLDEHQMAHLVAEAAPIDGWGVGTQLGTSTDSPTVSGVYKLVADRPPGWDTWRPVVKRSPEKSTVAHPKQVFRHEAGGRFTGDTIAKVDERLEGRPLLVPAMRGGELVGGDSLEDMQARARAELDGLAPDLRLPPPGSRPDPYPVGYSEGLRRLDPEAVRRALDRRRRR
jgi:nicotinate phosphoribosyltransferase